MQFGSRQQSSKKTETFDLTNKTEATALNYCCS